MNGVVAVADEIAPMLRCRPQAVRAALGLLPSWGIFRRWLVGAVGT